MNIHEHQAKQILKKYGAKVPKGIFAFEVNDLIEKAKSLNTEKYVLYSTYLLHKKGWHGVVVDIDDYKLKLFKKRRGSSVEVLKGAISSQDSES